MISLNIPAGAERKIFMAKEDRKGRRINYSRKELAEYLHCAETSVDYRLKKYLIITISWIVHRSKRD